MKKLETGWEWKREKAAAIKEKITHEDGGIG